MIESWHGWWNIFTLNNDLKLILHFNLLYICICYRIEDKIHQFWKESDFGFVKSVQDSLQLVKPRLESETSLKGFKGERRNAWKNRNSEVFYDPVKFRYNFSQIGKVICKQCPKVWLRLITIKRHLTIWLLFIISNLK